VISPSPLCAALVRDASVPHSTTITCPAFGGRGLFNINNLVDCISEAGSLFGQYTSGISTRGFANDILKVALAHEAQKYPAAFTPKRLVYGRGYGGQVVNDLQHIINWPFLTAGSCDALTQMVFSAVCRPTAVHPPHRIPIAGCQHHSAGDHACETWGRKFPGSGAWADLVGFASNAIVLSSAGVMWSLNSSFWYEERYRKMILFHERHPKHGV
jgi:hypothetical protein